ncbi:hypothetical protein [Brevibacillus massiliensis]|nr:hypothetical protein [Brevibacillus massiliensis]
MSSACKHAELHIPEKTAPLAVGVARTILTVEDRERLPSHYTGWI